MGITHPLLFTLLPHPIPFFSLLKKTKSDAAPFPVVYRLAHIAPVIGSYPKRLSNAAAAAAATAAVLNCQIK